MPLLNPHEFYRNRRTQTQFRKKDRYGSRLPATGADNRTPDKCIADQSVGASFSSSLFKIAYLKFLAVNSFSTQ